MVATPDKREKKVLNSGFVKLVDWMGDDKRIVDAARVSYQTGTKVVSDDRSLIRYLLKNLHTTPFEKVRFEFHVKLPIFVARQWMRHRMGCLSGDTELHYQRPDNGRVYPKKISDIFRTFHNSSQKDKVQKMQLRCFNEETYELSTTTVKDIWESGEQDLYIAYTKSGKYIRLTDTHQVFTEHGWELFGEARERFESGLSVKLFSVISGSKNKIEQTFPVINEPNVWKAIPGWENKYEVSNQGLVRSLQNTRGVKFNEPKIKVQTIANNGYPCVSLSDQSVSKLYTVHSLIAKTFLGEPINNQEVCHLNGNRLDARLSNLRYGTSSENSQDMLEHGNQCQLYLEPDYITSIDYDGKEMTYDLEVEGPHHNFIANGILVHNSFNEISARYSILPDEFYIPAKVRGQSEVNKQGSSDKVISEIPILIDEDGNTISIDSREYIQEHCDNAYATYISMINEGVAKELARMVLPVNTYTEFYWTVDLWNLMHFLRLRLDSHAQYEVRRYAEAMLDLIKINCQLPYSVEAFQDYILDAPKITKFELEVIKDVIQELKNSSFATEDIESIVMRLLDGNKSMSKRERSESKLASLLGEKK